MSDKKICPLLSIGRTADPALCLEDRCPWWHTYDRPCDKGIVARCALVSVADALMDIDPIGMDINVNN